MLPKFAVIAGLACAIALAPAAYSQPIASAATLCELEPAACPSPDPTLPENTPSPSPTVDPDPTPTPTADPDPTPGPTTDPSPTPTSAPDPGPSVGPTPPASTPATGGTTGTTARPAPPRALRTAAQQPVTVTWAIVEQPPVAEPQPPLLPSEGTQLTAATRSDDAAGPRREGAGEPAVIETASTAGLPVVHGWMIAAAGAVAVLLAGLALTYGRVVRGRPSRGRHVSHYYRHG